jgi:putative tryptophan/tyrosine transport system substrate-binding protein
MPGSLSKPGGNITGFTSFNAPIAGKWLELLKEVSPGTERAGVIFNPKTSPYTIFLPTMEHRPESAYSAQPNACR